MTYYVVVRDYQGPTDPKRLTYTLSAVAPQGTTRTLYMDESHAQRIADQLNATYGEDGWRVERADT